MSGKGGAGWGARVLEDWDGGLFPCGQWHSPDGLSSGDTAAWGVTRTTMVGDSPFECESQQGQGIPWGAGRQGVGDREWASG